MSGYLPAGASQDAMDRLLDDEDPDMEWDSEARRWVPAGTDDAREEEQESVLESPESQWPWRKNRYRKFLDSRLERYDEEKGRAFNWLRDPISW